MTTSAADSEASESPLRGRSGFPLRAGTGGRWPGRLRLLGVAGAVALGAAGCATAPAPPPSAPLPAAVPSPATLARPDLDESPPPKAVWREHRLARCRDDLDVPAAVERLLAESSEFFREKSGSDGIVELELACRAGQRHPLVLVTLGQLYLLAGQGDPSLLPREGPARDVGSWARNQPRLLARARELLSEAATVWTDDAGLDYLLADVARTAGDTLTSRALMSGAIEKCTGGRSFSLMQFYQQLNRYPARHEGGPPPDYPAAELAERVQGEVVVDLLLNPAAEVRQAFIVSAPAPGLADAAVACLRQGRFTPSRLGKYPVWSWLRVTVAFRLEG